MISDSIQNYSRYPFGPAWEAAFAFIKKLSPETPTGKQFIQGDRLYAGVDSYATKLRESAKLETHRKYVDIQLLLSGTEAIEIFPRRDLTVSEPYNQEKDVEFYQVPTSAPARVVLSPGEFLVFFPHDAHMPCLVAGDAPQTVKKVVIKVAVELLTA
jgi:YhcH/YjgK/YiaL family protein